MRRIVLALLIFSFGVSVKVNAQALSCTEQLQAAQTAFDAGKIQEVDKILRIKGSCFMSKDESALTPEEKFQGYRLLTLTYLQMDEIDKADDMMLLMLGANPEYQVNPAVDPTEFINLYNTWRTKPIFKGGLMGGANTAFFQNTTRWDVFDEPNHLTPTLGSQFGGVMEFDITDIINKESTEKDKFLITTELFFSSKKLTRTKGDEFTFMEDQTIVFTHSSLDLRALFNYNLVKKPGFQLFATLGGSMDWLLINDVQAVAGSVEASGGETVESTKKDIGIMYKNFSGAVLGGSSLRIKVGRPWLVLDIRYHYYFTDPFIPENRFSMPEINIDNGGMIPSSGYLSYYSANLGVLVPVFKHVKKKTNSYDE